MNLRTNFREASRALELISEGADPEPRMGIIDRGQLKRPPRPILTLSPCEVCSNRPDSSRVSRARSEYENHSVTRIVNQRFVRTART